MALSFIGSRFDEEDFVQIGRLLFVSITLPIGPIDAVVTTVTHERLEGEGKARWFIGAFISQMTEADAERLSTYLEKRETGEAVLPQPRPS